MNPPRHGCAVLLGLFFSLAAARGQFALADPDAVQSVSGQFQVSRVADAAPAYRRPELAANTNLVRLKPALLAVAVERFKLRLWQQLDLTPSSPWSGKIFLAVLPAHTGDEPVTIASSPFLDHWNYRVELPDALARTRYVRALAAVLLLEIANRSAPRGGHSAELPAWLVDGMAQQVLAAEGDKVVLSAPASRDGEMAVGRLDRTERGLDPLAAAREVLQNAPVLTFDQMSWPADAQMEGVDGGAYFASAQLFLDELLGLKNGPAKMRALLAELPAHLNWQTAFFAVYQDEFKRPLDVEKWWALRVVNFAARAPGPRWTSEVSRDRLAELLNVPVEVRSDSNALPSHAEISLQAALKSLNPAEREWVTRLKVRDLGLVELRLAPPFGNLADGYRLTLADFLGELKIKKTAADYAVNKHAPAAHRPASLADTLKKLDALDRRRREAETQAVVPLPGNLRAVAP